MSAGPGLHLLYAVSGATALLYEIVWTRLLTLELGHTTASAGAVLAAFMGGLALGALAAGRWTPRFEPATLLKAYAGVEVAIAVLALAVPFEISAFHPALALAYGDGPGGAFFHTLRLSAAIAVVGLPATLMGASYPLVIVEGRAAGSLYAVNTAGAALGTLLTGFLLLPGLGLFRSTLVGVAGNVLVALIAWRLAKRTHKGGQSHFQEEKGGQSHVRSGTTRKSVTVPLSRPVSVTVPLIVALIATCVAGYAALSLELAWTRTFAMVMGPTTYAFTTSVACFIVGLAIGSGVAAWRLRAHGAKHPETWLALSLAAAALAIAWATGRVDQLVIAVARRTIQPDITYARLLGFQFGSAALLLTPMAVCFGAAFPLAIAAARATSGREAGWVYAANTVGAIAGALVTAAIVIPAIGLRGTFLLATALAGAMSLALALRSGRAATRLAGLAALTAVAAAALASTTRWSPDLLSSGAYKYAAYVGAEELEARLRAGSLNYYREGAAATVAVRDLAGVRALSIDGKVDASNGSDMLTQRLLAHLPLLLRPGSRRVAIIGLGSGVTAGSALTHPITQADVIEISPEVIEASVWFDEENRHALQDARVRLIQGDARTHFRLAASTYDVIISEPSNPWMAGVAALFTREFFVALRARLAPAGIVCQWAHTYDISTDDLKSILATFSDVFPHVSLWLVGESDLLLVGAGQPLPGRTAANAVPEEALRDLQAGGVTSPAVLHQFKIGDTGVARRWAGRPQLQSDDRMALEFTVPAATIGASRDDNASALLGSAEPADTSDPVVLRDAGLLALQAQAPDRAWALLDAAVARLPADPAALRGLVRAAGISRNPGRIAVVEARLRAAIGAVPEAVAPRLELARLLASRDDYENAQRVAVEAEQIAPASEQVQEELAAIAADAEDTSLLSRAVERLRILRPAAASTLYFEAVLRMLNGRADESLPFARAAVAADPRYAAAWNLLGSALGSTGAPTDEIRNAFARAIRADPSDPAAYTNLGTLELSSGHHFEAANWFAQALTVNPLNDAARHGLAAARSSNQ